MKPAQTAKAAGLNSIAEMSELSGVKIRTLQNWHYQNNQLFHIVAIGCVAVKENPELAEQSK